MVAKNIFAARFKPNTPATASGRDSKQYVVINTHRGLFRYNWLPFGVSSAPGIFQRAMESLLQGIPNIAIYLDDIYTVSLIQENVVWRRHADHLLPRHVLDSPKSSTTERSLVESEFQSETTNLPNELSWEMSSSTTAEPDLPLVARSLPDEICQHLHHQHRWSLWPQPHHFRQNELSELLHHTWPLQRKYFLVLQLIHHQSCHLQMNFHYVTTDIPPLVTCLFTVVE